VEGSGVLTNGHCTSLLRHASTIMGQDVDTSVDAARVGACATGNGFGGHGVQVVSFGSGWASKMASFGISCRDGRRVVSGRRMVGAVACAGPSICRYSRGKGSGPPHGVVKS
jgi:hypothetical protein